MPLIPIPDAHGGEVWRALVASGPLSCVAQEPIDLVTDCLLRRKKLPFAKSFLPAPLCMDRRTWQLGPLSFALEFAILNLIILWEWEGGGDHVAWPCPPSPGCRRV